MGTPLYIYSMRGIQHEPPCPSPQSDGVVGHYMNVLSAPRQAKKVKNTKMKAHYAKEEEVVATWISLRREGGFPVSGEDIIAKMGEAYEFLWEKEHRETGREPARPRTWEPSMGWLDKFKGRWGIREVKQAGESRSADTEAAIRWGIDFKQWLEDNDYDRRMVYNMDETGLFWRMLPDRSLAIVNEEKKSKG